MAGKISDYLVHKWLGDLDDVWLGLHFDNPDVAGAYASEVFGSGYSRQRALFSDPDARSTWNAAPVAFAGLPATVITHVSAWDTQVTGNMLWSSALSSPLRVLAGRQVTFGREVFAVSF